jgi:primosomal protein N' (replication factor Y)
VVSAEPVLTAEIARLVRTVADHYAGTFAERSRPVMP